MPEVALARAEVEAGKTDRLREWFAELETREAEVVETLQHEGVYTETAFVREGEDADYRYVYMEAQDLEAADEAGDAETYEIDEKHHAVLRETLTAEWEQLDTVGHFTNPALRS